MSDLRSDTVTRPTLAMRAAMAAAEVGDDVYGEDPTVNALEEAAAARTGKAAALFCPSGTAANLLALLSHTRRGDVFLVGRQAHAYDLEAAGSAFIAGILAMPLENQPDGTLLISEIAAALADRDYLHQAPVTLLCLEDTFRGGPLPRAWVAEATALARARGLALHLDGARLFNSAVAQGLSAAEVAAPFDTVAFCLSKGLGTPVGSMLCGPAELIHRARRWRKAIGGGMRQVGVLAAAGLYALEHHVDRLAEDHRNAARLAQGLAAIDGLTVLYGGARTNMVWCAVAPEKAPELGRFLLSRGIQIDSYLPIRLVTHLDVTAEDVERVIEGVRDFFDA